MRYMNMDHRARSPRIFTVLPDFSYLAQKMTSMVEPSSTPLMEMKKDLRRPRMSKKYAPMEEKITPAVPDAMSFVKVKA